ncbi:MAG: tryptophan 2,3-dioxygenase [Acidobacteriota bacterium]
MSEARRRGDGSASPPGSPDLDYETYLNLPALLGLQVPHSSPEEHDELLFIVIHQVYELWFKLLLHEFSKIQADLSANRLFGCIATFKRVRTIMKTLVGQIDILETMTPMSFLAFRERLDTASGFQSVQFRELEFALGYKRPELLKHFAPGSTARKRLETCLARRTLIDHFYDFLEHRGVAIPAKLRERDLARPARPHPDIQAGVLRLYRDQPDAAILLELMTDFDEGLQEWRYRHVKMVERTIGNKQGTGGSLGVEFLRRTLFHALFPDLWAVRHQI